MLITALAGGSGAAKFLKGLVRAVDPAEVTVIGNTGDDAVIHGLHISPDLDIVTYALAGVLAETGWGLAGDTTNALDQLRSYGVDAWFTLKDKDLGTHLARTTWMGQGAALSEITDRLRRSLGVTSRILPMSNDPVRTRLTTVEGHDRDFQEYFVRFRHQEPIREVRFEGAEEAKPAPGVLDAIHDAGLIIVCPSNPVVSIGPILAVNGVLEALRENRNRVVAISPIVAGAALKGPADKLLGLLGAESSAAGVASLYKDFCGTFVLDHRDSLEAPEVTQMGVTPLLLETVMETDAVAEELARAILAAI